MKIERVGRQMTNERDILWADLSKIVYTNNNRIYIDMSYE